MASTARLVLRRLPASISPSFRIARSAVNPTTAARSLKAYSQFCKVSSNSLLLSRKCNSSNVFGAVYPVTVQCRSYADVVVKVPQMAESISEGTLKQWQKKVGDYVEADEEIASIETDKIDVAVNAPEAGTIKEVFVNEEDTVTVGQELCKIETGGEKPAESEKNGTAPEAPKESGTLQRQEQQKSESEGESTEPGHKIEPSEHKPEVSRPAEPAPPPPPPPPPPPKKERAAPSSNIQRKAPAVTSPFGSREEQRLRMTPIRRRIAERLKESQNTAAFVTTFQEADMSAVKELRAKYIEEILDKTGVKLGFMSFFCKASALAIKEIPTVNAAIEGPPGEQTIVYRDYVDISVAVATPKGLVTPIVRNVESMSLIEIEQKIIELGTRARDGKITIEEMAGGTFTISNGGVFGNLMGTPIINLPQSAVLGMHAIKDRPIAVKGQVVIRPMMYLALTYDHRLLDGREAVTFLLRVKEYIEDPRKMLLAYTPK